MKQNLLKLQAVITLLLLFSFVIAIPAQAGEPDKTVGPGNPNLLVCADGHKIVPLDSDAFTGYSNETASFDPTIEVDVKKLKDDCERAQKSARNSGLDVHYHVEYLQQTRIQGAVFEFHPDSNAPGGWMAVRSYSVPVIASGPGFEVTVGSDKDGSYFFDNLGAGPVTLNLGLPPDAHPLNPNIIVMSRSFLEIWYVDLGFYRGDIPPENLEELRLPADYDRSTLLPPDTIIEIDESGNISYMPNVGGVLPPSRSITIVALAAILLIVLPIFGLTQLRRKRQAN